MEKVVYILGAGFSAPLGLPVMSNFLQKSRDKYESDKDRFSSFLAVYDMFEELNRVGRYYETDLDNIENLLSILDFRARFSPNRQGDEDYSRLITYIKDVIETYTPALSIDGPTKNWPIFTSTKWKPYVAFVASVFNSFIGTKGFDTDFAYLFLDKDVSKFRYDIITLNYDRVLEKCEEYINHFGNKNTFSRELRSDSDRHTIYLAKLHGDIKKGDIIPPTSNKGLHRNNSSDWQLAYKLLSEANHIRILGYSLPKTDAYIKYLLQSAITEPKFPNLKSFDVICIDDGTVEEQYRNFVGNKKIFRFLSRPIQDYLENHLRFCNSENGVFTLNTLQESHESFFKPSD